MDLPLSHVCWCRSALLKLHSQLTASHFKERKMKIRFMIKYFSTSLKMRIFQSLILWGVTSLFQRLLLSAKNPENVNLNFVWRLSAPVLELTDLPCFSGEEASNWRLEEPFKIIIKGFWSLLFTMFVPFSQEIPKKLKSFRQNIRLFFLRPMGNGSHSVYTLLQNTTFGEKYQWNFIK